MSELSLGKKIGRLLSAAVFGISAQFPQVDNITFNTRSPSVEIPVLNTLYTPTEINSLIGGPDIVLRVAPISTPTGMRTDYGNLSHPTTSLQPNQAIWYGGITTGSFSLSLIQYLNHTGCFVGQSDMHYKDDGTQIGETEYYTVKVKAAGVVPNCNFPTRYYLPAYSEPTSTPTPEPTNTPTITPTPTESPTATTTPTETPTQPATETPIATATQQPTDTVTVIPTFTLTSTATATYEPTWTVTPTKTPTSTPSPTPIVLHTTYLTMVYR